MLIVVAVLSRKISNFSRFFCCIESVLPECEHTYKEIFQIESIKILRAANIFWIKAGSGKNS